MKIEAPPPPDDFAAFWEETYRLATARVPEYRIEKEIWSPDARVKILQVRFRSYDGFDIGMWIARPESSTGGFKAGEINVPTLAGPMQFAFQLSGEGPSSKRSWRRLGTASSRPVTSAPTPTACAPSSTASRATTCAGLRSSRRRATSSISATQERNESIWAARGAFLEAIKASTTEMDECDVVVPRSHVAEFVLFSHALQKKHGVRIRSFGHAGDGNLHIYVLRDDLAEDAWKQTLAAVFEELYAKARELGGQVSGEHGIGYAKKPYLRESLDPVVRALMRGVKDVFDPHHILNPGKVID